MFLYGPEMWVPDFVENLKDAQHFCSAAEAQREARRAHILRPTIQQVDTYFVVCKTTRDGVKVYL
jgi:hypothetical protein